MLVRLPASVPTLALDVIHVVPNNEPENSCHFHKDVRAFKGIIYMIPMSQDLSASGNYRTVGNWYLYSPPSELCLYRFTSPRTVQKGSGRCDMTLKADNFESNSLQVGIEQHCPEEQEIEQK